ncbi:MAG: hypothetical protein KBE65_02685 [Phycisphaerae bacterium]|nr:hypothetical protein [Phycisphaerae bacterium]
MAWNLQHEDAAITLAGPPIAAKADTPYVFMGHYASECNDIECRIDWQDDAGRVLASKRWALPETQGQWIEFFEDITSPADPLTSPSSVKTLQIHIAHGGAVGQVRLDDFSLRQGELRDFPDDICLPPLPKGANDFPIFGWMEPALWNHFMDFYDRGTEYDLDRYHAEFAMAGFTVGRQARFGLRRYVTPYPVNYDDLMEGATDPDVIWISASNDEPWPHEFATLAEQNERVLKYAPSKPLWANLLPTYGFAFYESYQVYIDYIRGYIETVHPTFFTFDHYPFALRDDVRPDFFPNLEIVRDETRSASIDFGVIALVHQANETRRNLDENELKWQAYSCLAYGAKALGWFTYFTHTDYAERVGGPGSAVIDWYGNRTRQYSMLKRIHAEIRMLGDTLLDLQSTGVFHTDPLPHMTHPVSESDWIQTVAGDECILGEFRHSSGHRYLMVLNRDLLGRREYRVTFRTPHASAAEVSKTTGSLIELGNNQFDGQTLTVWVASGDGRLFRIE